MTEPTSRGPYRTGLARREQILSAATAAFARRGYAGASLREIAKDVGVTAAGLLRHFESKESLLIAVLQRWDDENELLIHRDVCGLRWFEQHCALMYHHEKHPGFIELFLTLSAEASDPHHPARTWITQRYQQLIDDGTRELRVAISRGEIKPMSETQMEQELRGLFGLMDGLELQWISNPEIELAATFQVLFDGIVARWREV